MIHAVIINHSDTQGGAAIVSMRLMHALRQQGVDARMLVIDRQDIDVYARQMGSTLRNKWNFLAERLGIFVRNGFSRDTLFKIDTMSHGLDVTGHPWVKQADVVMLNWVNQGTLSFRSVERLHRAGKPVIWTMHDMWNCTGVCHYAFDCRKYTARCEACPLLGGKGTDLSTRIQRRKQRLYEQVPIRFVAVSHWLQDCCRNSALMARSDVRVIYNAFPIHEFDCTRLSDDGYEGIPQGRKVVIMGARRLDVEVKGFKEFIEAMQYIATERPQLAQRIHVLLYGDLGNRSLLDQIPVSYSYVGTVGGNRINELYRHSDVVLSTALYENLPGTLIEGQASGCLPVTFGHGGQADIVDHLKSGYIADYRSPASVANGLQWAIDAGIQRQWLHDEVKRKFDAAQIAARYIELFHEILDTAK